MPPLALIGEAAEVGKVGGGHHAGFVDEEGCPSREVVAGAGAAVLGVFDEELGDRVARCTDAVAQNARCGC